jgi:arylsulfatase A-like enzyme
MKRRDFLRLAGLGATSLVLHGLASARGNTSPTEKPNIVLVVLDEWGYCEMSCLGHEHHQTPNIDKMAAEGMRFTQALAGAPVCAPSRSVLMTGQHLGHTTVRTNPGGVPLRADDVTIAQVLKKAGYAAGGFGKWGCGDRGTTGAPELHGFDVFFGYYHQVHAHSYFPNYLARNGEKVPLDGNTGDFYKGKQFSHYLIFEETLKFIRANKDRPFFCYCPWTPPHGVWAIPEDEPSWQKFKDKPWTAGDRTPNDAKVYAAMVNMCNRQIGQIMDLLRDLGLDDKTIVFVCGDNGTHRYFGDFFKPNGPFRGQKGDLYEGGLRVPMTARWPGRIRARAVSDHVWYFADVLPTLAELVGVQSPANIDGISIVPTLLGEDEAGRKQEKHKYLYWEYQGQVAVRMGEWKAVKPGKNRPFELYDLSKDVGEQNNVATKCPEILGQMEQYAQQAHSENVPCGWIDQSKQFAGH